MDDKDWEDLLNFLKISFQKILKREGTGQITREELYR